MEAGKRRGLGGITGINTDLFVRGKQGWVQFVHVEFDQILEVFKKQNRRLKF